MPAPPTPLVEGAPLVLEPAPPPKRGKASDKARAAYLGDTEASIEVPEAYVPPPVLDPNHLDALGKAASEVQLDAGKLGDVWLVAERTGQKRMELTYSEMATLRAIVDVFPGARVVELKPAPVLPRPGDDLSPEAERALKDGLDSAARGEVAPWPTCRHGNVAPCEECGQELSEDWDQ